MQCTKYISKAIDVMLGPIMDRDDKTMNAVFTSLIDQEIISLENRLNSVDNAERARLESMIAFRRSPDAIAGFRNLTQHHAVDFVHRACACRKRIALKCEEVPTGKLAGGILEKIAARFKPVAQIYRLASTSAEKANVSMNREGSKGILGGYITDEFYQSPKLFPDFNRAETQLPVLEKLKRQSAGTVELRNRYRRVINLSLREDRLTYFKQLRQRGVGTPRHPIHIASIGGGTGSVEMDIQQALREKYNLYSRIVIFDVVDQNRINGSFFAKMRGADICWVIHTPGENDLLTQWNNGTIDRFTSTPLRGVDPHGNACVIAAKCAGLFHHVVMSGLWPKFNDEQIAAFLGVTKKIMHMGAEAVVTLSWNKYIDKRNRERTVAAMQIIDHLGHDLNGVWYRNIKTLLQSGLLKDSGFTLTSARNGPILPVIAIAPKAYGRCI